MVTLTWHACKYKVHKPHQRYILLRICCTCVTYFECYLTPLFVDSVQSAFCTILASFYFSSIVTMSNTNHPSLYHAHTVTHVLACQKLIFLPPSLVLFYVYRDRTDYQGHFFLLLRFPFLCTCLYSVGTHDGNRLQSLGTMHSVTHFTPQTHTGYYVHYKYNTVKKQGDYYFGEQNEGEMDRESCNQEKNDIPVTGRSMLAIFSPILGFKGEHVSALGSQPKGL